MEFLSDPARVAEARRAYGAAALAMGVTVPAFISALAFAAAGTSAAHPAAGHTTAIRLIVWVLVAAHLPAMLWTRRALERGSARDFRLAFAVQSQVQIQWVLLLAWFLGPAAPQVTAAVLTGMIVGWAFNDAQLAHDSRFVRAQYLLAFPVFAALLLLLDATMGRGALSALRDDRAFVVSFGGTLVVLASLSQLVLVSVGRIARERMEEQARALALRVSNERLAVEHLLLRRVAGLLSRGVTAGQFSHDIASPLLVLGANIDCLEEGLALRGGGADAEDTRALLAEMREATERLQELGAAAMSTIRSGGDLSACPVAELVDRASSHARKALREHPDRPLDVTRRLAPCSVRVSPMHSQAIGNIMVNAVMQQAPGVAIELEGREVSATTYALSLRDHGVAPEGRPATLARIQRSFSLDDDGVREARTSDYRGFGMGLLLARTLVVSGGGTFEVRAPASGRGVVVEITLPRAEPAEDADPDQRTGAPTALMP